MKLVDNMEFAPGFEVLIDERAVLVSPFRQFECPPACDCIESSDCDCENSLTHHHSWSLGYTTDCAGGACDCIAPNDCNCENGQTHRSWSLGCTNDSELAECPAIGTGACDCDCSPDAARLSWANNLSSLIVKVRTSPGLISYPLTPNRYVVANPGSTPSVVVLSEVAHQQLMEFNDPDLVNMRKISGTDTSPISMQSSLSYQGFLSEVKRPRNPRTLASWLHITDSCSLACKYCHVTKSSRHMSVDVGRTAIEAIFREAIEHNFKRVKIKYSGGEPSLNLGLVEKLHDLALKQSATSQIDLEELFLTNGVMTDAQRKRVAKMGIRAMVSLDALNEDHDVQRPFLRSVGSSSSLAKETLLDFLKMDVDVYVSIVVAKQRPRSLIELIDFLLDLDVPFSLNYARDNPNYSTLDDFRPTNATLVDTLSQVIDHLCKSPPKHSLLGSFVDRVNMSFPHRHTCALGQNYMVIGPLGRVFLCQQEMRHPVTSIYETDILTKLANSKLVENPTVDTKENCADCQWRYWCAGGCPVLSTYINGTSKVSSPFCEVYRAIIPKAVRLEGLRLLKHGQTLLS